MGNTTKSNSHPLKIAVLCGGPSLERGISLNSARSVMDHLGCDQIVISPYYFDQKKNAYGLSSSQLYSNTPADFDFKLSNTAFALDDEQLEKELKSVDLVFPVMHGSFGEDGTIQKWLEDRGIDFVGAPSRACKKAFDKYKANEFIKKNDFFTLPSCVLKIYKENENEKTTRKFFEDNNITRAIVKPATGGSSIGVFSVNNVEQALEKAELIFSKRMDTRVVIEPFAQGREFTVIILQSRHGLPIAILPTEIEADYTQHQIFDFRKKYLPTRQVTYHCPPRFEDEVIEKIQIQSEQLFALLGMNDFARFDGWVLDDGNIWFSDFNPISGMEQNSFLFQQSARAGLSHQDVLKHIVNSACRRQDIERTLDYDSSEPGQQGKIDLPVLMGGTSSERQVSLMSGTNVWLKLRKSEKYNPIPYLMEDENTLWQVPYQLLLNHTVEEIIDNCKLAQTHKERVSHYEKLSRQRLGFFNDASSEFGMPEKISLDDLLSKSAMVFLALHGDFGEDGTLQRILEDNSIKHNGPGSRGSKVAMDKQLTAELVEALAVDGIHAISGVSYSLNEISTKVKSGFEEFWTQLTKEIGARSIIAKPSSDGCSSGVVHLFDTNDLEAYLKFATSDANHIPPNTFRGQSDRIELPSDIPDAIRFEKFMRSDSIKVKGGQLKHVRKSELVEVTVGVVEIEGEFHAFNPSITIADGEVLSVEEKFQGGTGINLTPPPTEIMSQKIRENVKAKMELLCRELHLDGYCRIDAFVNCVNGDVHIIEANSLPALTPSTVLFQQGLAEENPIEPLELLELICANKC